MEGTEVNLEWVHQLRGLYRNSATGNADNRGLDSAFARDTYIRTLLDRSLLPDIVGGKRQLVFLTGNPGDGKTAFLEKVRDELKRVGAASIAEDRYGWTWKWPVVGTKQSMMHRSRAETVVPRKSSRGRSLRLEGIPNPSWLDSQSCWSPSMTADCTSSFKRIERNSDGWPDEIDRLIFGIGVPDERIAVVDLKRRALVQLPGKPASLFSQMLDALVKQSHWDACAGSSPLSWAMVVTAS